MLKVATIQQIFILSSFKQISGIYGSNVRRNIVPYVKAEQINDRLYISVRHKGTTRLSLAALVLLIDSPRKCVVCHGNASNKRLG